MGDGFIQHRGTKGEAHCEFHRTLQGEYCTQNGEVKLDSSMFCNRHADRLRVKERVTYWRAMLAHVELWSGEARRQGRDDVVGCLEKVWARSAAALGCILEDLEESRDLDGENGSGEGRDPPNGDRYS